MAMLFFEWTIYGSWQMLNSSWKVLELKNNWLSWLSMFILAYSICLVGRAANKAYDRSHRKARIIIGRPLIALRW